MSTDLPPVAITGATGGIGGRVARALAAQGVPLRLLARSPERVTAMPGVVTLPLDYGDRRTGDAAFAGVELLLLVSAAEDEHRLEQHRTVVAAAAEAGVRHVVYTSFQGAAPDALFTLARDHAATEQAIRETGMAFTFLRDSLYTDFLPMLAGPDGIIRGPAGTGRAATVTRDDVARVATAVLLHPAEHRGATYDLTGPEALTMTEIADTIAAATGRPVSFHDETLEEALESRRRYGAPDWQVEAWISTYTAIAGGELARVSDAVPRITGRPATSLAEFLRQQSPSD